MNIFLNVVLCLNITGGMTNSVGASQQSDQGIHCLLRPTCPILRF